MLWEIANDIKRRIKMTVLPALRNLFSSVRSLIGMFLVMLVMQVLLSVICVYGIDNIKNQQTVLGEFEQVTETMAQSIEYQQGSFITSDSFKTAMSSTSVLVGALIIWGICAIAVYQKVMFASADRDKYIWGMYVTHGAKKKKVKGMLKSELYLPHAAATVIAYPLSLILCSLFFSDQGKTFGFSFLTVIAIILLSYLCIRLVVEYQWFLIKSMSCTQMLRNEDAPKSICFPRKFSKLIKGFSPTRYGTSAFLRMRKYYLSLALIAAIPAVIWVCFSVSSTSQSQYLASDIKEFSVTLGLGVDEEQMAQIQNDDITQLEGISSVSTSANYDAQKLYSHLLADKKYFSRTSNSPYYTTSYADNTMTLCCSDRSFKSRTGFSNPFVPEGSVAIVAPKNDLKYKLQREDRVFFAVSKENGTIRPIDKTQYDRLSDVPNNEYKYIALTVVGVSEVESQYIDDKGYLNVNETYMLLNPADYERIVGVSADKFSSRISYPDIVNISTLMNSNGSFTITLNKQDLKALPSAGDCIELSGSYTAKLNFKDGEYDMQGHQLMGRPFTLAYINSVTDKGFSIVLNVTPCDVIELAKTGSSVLGNAASAVLALGTPPLPSTTNRYCAATHENTQFINGTISINQATGITVYACSAVTAEAAGTHAVFPEEQLHRTDIGVKLEQYHVDNNFDIACGDTTTLSLLGYGDIPNVLAGNATLVLPSSALNHFNFALGDKLRLAITKEDIANYNDNGVLYGSSGDLLLDTLSKNQYDYVTVRVNSIIFRDDVTRPCVLLSADDFSAVIAKKAPYARFTISLDPEVGISQYATIIEKLNEWTRGKMFSPEISSMGAYLEHLLRRHANYERLMLLIGIIVPLIIPFIWYYPLVTLFDRRRTEVRVLEATGKKRRTIRGCFFVEGALVGASAFGAVLALCLPAMLIFKALCFICKLPLEFSFGSMRISTILIAAAASALCSVVSFGICYATTSTGRIKKKRKENGNS